MIVVMKSASRPIRIIVLAILVIIALGAITVVDRHVMQMIGRPSTSSSMPSSPTPTP
jgi:hypothetical protein